MKVVGVFRDLVKCVLLEVSGQPQLGLTPCWLISDFGQTTSYLMNLGINVSDSVTRKQSLDEICIAIDIQQEAGELQGSIRPSERIAIYAHIVRLTQACVQIADLCFS